MKKVYQCIEDTFFIKSDYSGLSGLRIMCSEFIEGEDKGERIDIGKNRNGQNRLIQKNRFIECDIPFYPY